MNKPATHEQTVWSVRQPVPMRRWSIIFAELTLPQQADKVYAAIRHGCRGAAACKTTRQLDEAALSRLMGVAQQTIADCLDYLVKTREIERKPNGCYQVL